MKVTKDQILKIPKLKQQGKTNAEIAVILGVGLRTIYYWVDKLRAAGHIVPRVQKKSLDLTK